MPSRANNTPRNPAEPSQPPLESAGRSVADDIIIFTLSRPIKRQLFLDDVILNLKRLNADADSIVKNYLKRDQSLESTPETYFNDAKNDFKNRLDFLIWQAQNR